MHSLSERLKLIASFVPQGVSVCDVGTDHAYLPAALYLSGKYKSVTATDIREKPLQNAKENIEKLGADKVKLVLCDGLDGVSESDAQAVIIAGMGGEVISGIIDRCAFKERSVFILEPMRGADFLRSFLAENGFDVLKEQAVCENGKIYSVMLCRFDGVFRSLTASQKRIGILKADSRENTAYIKRQIDVCKKCIEDLESADKKTDFYYESKTALEEMKKVLEG